MNSKYDKIKNLKRPISKYPSMSIYNRSAQFAAFQALTGYDEKIKETARLTNKKIILTTEEQEIISNKINIIESKINNNINVEVLYFIKDKYKPGGKYETYIGCVRKIDQVNKTIIFKDKKIIKIDDILNIKED